MRACVRACVHACMRAAYIRACVCVMESNCECLIVLTVIQNIVQHTHIS